ncbi:MAG: hypothetical protein WCF67_02055 [Chitinophagaceae bacterium]
MRLLRFADGTLSVFVVFLVIYLLTLTSNFTGPHDSMAYLNMLKTEHGLWHPHHLLYHVSSKYWLGFWKMVFPSVEDYLIIESFSSVWGAATLSLVFRFFRKRFNLPVLTSWLGTAVIGFSYGIWFYSVNVEVYMPALFFTLWSLYILGEKEWSAKEVWRASLVHSLAILFHQMNILLVPVLLYKIWSQRKNIYVFKSIFWYALTGAAVVGGMYFIGGWIIEGHNDFSKWFGWIRGYTETNEYWQPLSWKTPLFAALGFLRTIVGGQFLFRLGDAEENMNAFLKVHALQDEQFLVRNLSTGMVWTIFILSMLLGVLMLILFIRFIRKFRENMRTSKHVITPLLLYVAIYSFYFLFWMPEILEFWLGHCVIFWLLLIGTYKPVGRRLNIISGSIAVLLFVINFSSSIRPMQDIKNDIGYARIEKLTHAATANDLVLVQDPWLLKDFIEYYTKSHVEAIPKDKQQAQNLHVRINNALATGNRVFVFPRPGEEREIDNTEFIPALKNEFGARMKLFQEGVSTVWVIE